MLPVGRIGRLAVRDRERGRAAGLRGDPERPGIDADVVQVAVEERMGCGYGLCGTCAVPLAFKDGSGWDHARACVDGPVFNPARVLWDRWPAAATDRLVAMIPTALRRSTSRFTRSTVKLVGRVFETVSSPV